MFLKKSKRKKWNKKMRSSKHKNQSHFLEITLTFSAVHQIICLKWIPVPVPSLWSQRVVVKVQFGSVEENKLTDLLLDLKKWKLVLKISKHKLILYKINLKLRISLLNRKKKVKNLLLNQRKVKNNKLQRKNHHFHCFLNLNQI